jgi:hypothetical protein
MELQTKIPLESRADHQIAYTSRILLMGSCFTEYIGEKLAYYKFRNVVNPFGILFHPKAIERLILRALKGEAFEENDLFYLNERWQSFEVHSSLSNASKDVLLDHLNAASNQLALELNEASHIIITLGTAWVYRHIQRDTLVASCHKVPQKQFSKSLMTVTEIVSSLQNMEKEIRLNNVKAQIIYTVSPVRHLKDGFVENNLSKSHLVTAIHEVLDSNSSYFPSYEIMMDELRDYRFYGRDMVHPNPTAVDYIWDRFKKVWMDEKTASIRTEVEAIRKAENHMPFDANSRAHKDFLQKLGERKTNLKKQFPHIDF